MKLTDFALIFVAVFLPVVIITYVNTTFVVKSTKNEIYYKSIIASATKDAVTAMKEIENPNIDYGYSGIVNKKISINADAAISAFYSSLANNFNIEAKDTLERLKMYIPVIAIIDYDGIYIHSIEETADDKMSFITKPKIRYITNYVLTKEYDIFGGEETYGIVNVEETDDISSLDLLTNHMYEINFTMDDYVYLKIYDIDTHDLVFAKAFYLTDAENNENLIYADDITSADAKELKIEIIKYLSGIRQDTIAKLGIKHISYAINKHNEYARLSDIKYKFAFAIESDETWYEMMNGVGMIAIIQGISLGNKYLNYKSYSMSELTSAKQYCISVAIDTEDTKYYLKDNLYHASEKCIIYQYYMNNVKELVKPTYFLSKADAATQGYYSCPICKP